MDKVIVPHDQVPNQDVFRLFLQASCGIFSIKAFSIAKAGQIATEPILRRFYYGTNSAQTGLFGRANPSLC